jgi:hypothetical protein
VTPANMQPDSKSTALGRWEKVHGEVEALTTTSRWDADEREEAQLYAQMLIADSQRRVTGELARFSRLCKYLSDTRLFFDRYPIVEARDE